MLLQLGNYNPEIIQETRYLYLIKKISAKSLLGKENHTHSLMKQLQVSKQKIEDIKNATQCDPGIQALIMFIQDVQPEQRKSCHPQVIGYWNHCDELT